MWGKNWDKPDYLKEMKSWNKYGWLITLSCLYFTLNGQENIHITATDSCTSIQFQNSKVDTTFYFMVPELEQYYSIDYQNTADTQWIHLEQQSFHFRDCAGLKIRFWGDCNDKTIQINIHYDFSKDNMVFSSAFMPAYQTLFANIKHTNHSIKSKSSLLIVYYQDFKNVLTNFAERKTQNDIDCYLLEVHATHSITTIQQNIKNYYELYHPDYLLFIGDDEHIPTYRMDEALSDWRYTLLKGNDDFPEMIVGRISANNIEELNLQLDKINNRNELSFSKKAIGIASDNYSDISGIYDWEYMRALRTLLLNKNFLTVYELYDGSQGEEDADGNPTTNHILEKVNEGVSLINYLGYGSYDEWETGNFTNTDINYLTNTNEYPLVISSACLNGYFADRDCLAEKWMKASYNGQACGAAACLMFSSLIDWDAAIYGQQMINANLPPTDSCVRLGDIFLQTYVQLLMHLERSKDALSWIYFGDPMLETYPKHTTRITDYFKEDINVYPNPTSNQLSIDNGNLIIKEIFLYDIMGKEVGRCLPHTYEKSISVNHLQKGIYLLKIVFPDESFCIKKIIKI